MGKTRSRRRDNLITIASGDKALTLYHRCSYTLTLVHLVGFTFLCFLPGNVKNNAQNSLQALAE